MINSPAVCVTSKLDSFGGEVRGVCGAKARRKAGGFVTNLRRPVLITRPEVTGGQAPLKFWGITVWQNTLAPQSPRAQKVLSKLRAERAVSIQRALVQVEDRFATPITQGQSIRVGGSRRIENPEATGKRREAILKCSRVGENPADTPLKVWSG